MRNQNAFFLMPLTAYEKSAVVSCSLTVNCPDSRKKKTVNQEIKSKVERTIFSNTSAKEYSVFTVLCNNLTAAEEIQRWIRRIDGVGGVTMGIVKEFVIVPDWLDEQIGLNLRAVRSAGA